MPNPEVYRFYSVPTNRTPRHGRRRWLLHRSRHSTPTTPWFTSRSSLRLPSRSSTGQKTTSSCRSMPGRRTTRRSGQKELVWIETHNHIELYGQDPYVSIRCCKCDPLAGQVPEVTQNTLKVPATEFMDPADKTTSPPDGLH